MSLLEGTAWDPRYRMRMGSFFFIFAGCSLALWGGCRDLKETWYSKSEPQELTAEQLVKDGPGGNLHVLVTDYTTSVDGVGNGDTAMYLVRPRVWQEGEPTIVLKASGGHPLFGVAVPEDGLQGMVRNGKHAFSVDQKI
ncbi:MAG: hypothetical protein KDA41_03365 [Planctomycetales bacterium]|nr:hypothetical protein [Planctomycetales bacterium]